MTPQREGISESEIVRTRYFTLSSSDRIDARKVPTQKFDINGEIFEFHTINTVVKSGTSEKWILRSLKSHSFHIHIVPFLVTEIHTSNSNLLNDKENYKALVTDQISNGPIWRDVITVPPKGNATILVKFNAHDPVSNDPFVGRSVYHCHMENHSDLGMIHIFQVNP